MSDANQLAPDRSAAPRLSYATGLTLDMAETMARAAVAEAGRQGIAISVAIVDAGGHLVNFARMNDAMLASIQIATDKAYTAVVGKIPTYLWQNLLQSGELPQLFVHDRWTAFTGGFPIVQGTRLLGAVGISGAEKFGDTTVARAALLAGDMRTTEIDGYLKDVLGVTL